MNKSSCSCKPSKSRKLHTNIKLHYGKRPYFHLLRLNLEHKRPRLPESPWRYWFQTRGERALWTSPFVRRWSFIVRRVFSPCLHFTDDVFVPLACVVCTEHMRSLWAPVERQVPLFGTERATVIYKSKKIKIKIWKRQRRIRRPQLPRVTERRTRRRPVSDQNNTTLF